ncbi:hypothetical protein VUR80DRAFT_1349 [Thermomyces stellatus]
MRVSLRVRLRSRRGDSYELLGIQEEPPFVVFASRSPCEFTLNTNGQNEELKSVGVQVTLLGSGGNLQLRLDLSSSRFPEPRISGTTDTNLDRPSLDQRCCKPNWVRAEQ